MTAASIGRRLRDAVRILLGTINQETRRVDLACLSASDRSELQWAMDFCERDDALPEDMRLISKKIRAQLRMGMPC